MKVLIVDVLVEDILKIREIPSAAKHTTGNSSCHSVALPQPIKSACIVEDGKLTKESKL